MFKQHLLNINFTLKTQLIDKQVFKNYAFMI